MAALLVTGLVTDVCDPTLMNALITMHPTNDDIRQAAESLVSRYGRGAKDEAVRRADVLAREGRWPEHALALRVLTVVEQLTGDAR